MTEIDQGPWLTCDRRLVLPPHSINTALVNTGNATNGDHPNNDGESNLYEFATLQNDTLETRLALLPYGSNGSRFVRLRLTP